VALAAGALGFGSLMRRCPSPWPVTFWWAISWIYCKLVFRVRRVGPCTVPATGPVIVVANHTSAIDPLLLVATIPSRVPAFLVAKEFSDPPVFGNAVRSIDCIPVRRDGQDSAATRAALRFLKAGRLLGIFIEGRIAQPGETLEAKDGATMLALHSGALIVPAHISGTRWVPGVLTAFLLPQNAQVRYGEPIDPRAWAGPRPDKEAVGRASEMLLERIRELGRGSAHRMESSV
jgi:1-acyl-sn-glycerol-3-phosphate acyltransferase